MKKYIHSSTSEYMQLESLYDNLTDFADTDTAEYADFIEDLEHKNIPFDTLPHKTDNGCTVFYDSGPVSASTAISAAAISDDDDDAILVADDNNITDTLEDMSDKIDDIQDAVDDVDEDTVDIETDNNIENHYIAECDKCHGIFISAVIESDQEVEKVSGICPLCESESDQYLKWVVKSK